MMFPAFGYYESSCREHACAGFCVTINFHFFVLNVQTGVRLLGYTADAYVLGVLRNG